MNLSIIPENKNQANQAARVTSPFFDLLYGKTESGKTESDKKIDRQCNRLVRRLLAAAISCSLFILPVWADTTTKPSGYSESTLHPRNIVNAPLGTRSMGMGHAQTGNSDDLSAVYYNPAGMATINYFEGAFQYQELGQDVHGLSGIGTIPFKFGAVALQASYFYVKDSTHVFQRENTHPDRNKYSWIAGASYGFPIIRKYVNAGASVKWVGADFIAVDSPVVTVNNVSFQQRYYTGVFFDLGFLAQYDFSYKQGYFLSQLPKVSFGLSVRNIHPLFKITDEAGEVDPQLRMGISFHYRYNFMLNADAIYQKGYHPEYRAGLEWWPAVFMAWRGGVSKIQQDVKNYGIYWGLGLGESVTPAKLSLEYAGELRYLDPVGGTNKSTEYKHSIAFHQSFEKVLERKTNKGKIRLIPIAQTERYNNPLQFAQEMEADEMILEIIEIVHNNKFKEDKELIDLDKEKKDETDENKQDENKVDPDEDKKKDEKKIVFRKPKIAFFPFNVEFVNSEPKATELPAQIRRDLVTKFSGNAKVDLLSETRYKNTPQKERDETEFKYLNRLCLFFGVQLITFGTVFIDEKDGNVSVKLAMYKKGENNFGGNALRKAPDDNLKLLETELLDDAVKNIATLLDISDLNIK